MHPATLQITGPEYCLSVNSNASGLCLQDHRRRTKMNGHVHCRTTLEHDLGKSLNLYHQLIAITGSGETIKARLFRIKSSYLEAVKEMTQNLNVTNIEMTSYALLGTEYNNSYALCRKFTRCIDAVNGSSREAKTP